MAVYRTELTRDDELRRRALQAALDLEDGDPARLLSNAEKIYKWLTKKDSN